MKESELFWFINNKNNEEKNQYLDRLITKLESIKKENNRIQIWMLVLAFIYIGLDFDMIKDISFGFVKIDSKQNIVKLFIPIVYSFYLLQFATINYHRGLLLRAIKSLGHSLPYMEQERMSNNTFTNPILRLLMPFSLSEEATSSYFNNGKVGKISRILLLPLLLIILIPIGFQFYSIVDLTIKQWHFGWFEKIVIVATYWMIIVIIGYYLKIFRNPKMENNPKTN